MEKVIVSLTSWRARLKNLPVVIDSILKQTRKPDVIVLNLSSDELYFRLPNDIAEYLTANNVEVNWVKENVGVWKKFLPTLELYPDDLIIAIDDDYVYPKGMIADFLRVHKKHPNSPISGNRYWRAGVKCHCGCASLVKAEFLKGYEKYLTKETYLQCTSSDMFYTKISALNGYFYEETKGEYFTNMKRVESDSPEYSKRINKGGTGRSGKYLFSLIGYEVKQAFKTFGRKKPVCVFGVMHNEAGLVIMYEMLEWLTESYNVYVVTHNGSRFEYPAIRFVQTICTRENIPCLYIHTKGAFYNRKRTPKIRRMWADEFTRNKEAYFSAVDCDTPAVATPFTGQEKETWFNAFVANPSAMRAIGEIKLTNDRFYYERIFCRSDVEVKGIIMDNITQPIESRRLMHAYVDDNYGK